MKLLSKSEWFEFDSPIGEPNVKWIDKTYEIERLTKVNGDIIWFGQGVNWVKPYGKKWTVLSEDETVEPIETYYDENGNNGYCYPEERTIWIECEPPIYEKEYLKQHAR